MDGMPVISIPKSQCLQKRIRIGPADTVRDGNVIYLIDDELASGGHCFLFLSWGANGEEGLVGAVGGQAERVHHPSGGRRCHGISVCLGEEEGRGCRRPPWIRTPRLAGNRTPHFPASNNWGISRSAAFNRKYGKNIYNFYDI